MAVWIFSSYFVVRLGKIFSMLTDGYKMVMIPQKTLCCNDFCFLGKDEVASSNLAISSKTLNLLEIQGFFIFTEKAEDILLSPLYRKGSFSYLSYLIWSYQKFHEKLLISLPVNYTVKKPTISA